MYCLLDILRRCFPASIHSILDHLPDTLDETYEHMLLRIDKVKRQFAHRLFQCLVVSVRPLRVEELAEILAVRFDAGTLPQFNTDWRLGDAEEAVLSACSSLITIVNVNGSRIVQFTHFSVKEFLTSDRLAAASEGLSRYHIIPHSAHATLAQASLGVLLQLDDQVDQASIGNYPLADYAARHWFEHGRFESVSVTIRDVMERLFDRDKPHFSAWVWIYDIDDPWRGPTPTKYPEQPDAPPLYYAILCRLRWLVEHLIASYPEDIDARGGFYMTSWIAAFETGHIDIACSLLRSGVDINVLDSLGDNPLHKATENGRVDLVRLLLEYNANVDNLTAHRWTPLAISSCAGHVEIARLLLHQGANVNARAWEGWTPVNIASENGHLDVVRLLIDNGADVNSPSDKGRTPLHSAASNGRLDIVKVLLDIGADFDICNVDGKTALDLASDNGKLEAANFLSGYMAVSLESAVNPSTSIPQPRNKPSNAIQQLRKGEEKVNPSDDEQPLLFTASGNGQVDIVRSLLDRGSDVNETNSHRMTPLHTAAGKGYLEMATLLIERGAYVNSRSLGGWTPLQAASRFGHLEVARLLLDHGADVTAKTRDRRTALHFASSWGHLHIAQLLVERGADVDVRSAVGRTARHDVMMYGGSKVAEFLSGCGCTYI